ncbi:MAG: AmmeMemoRadiSam system protein B [Syntrophorhabdales bacterium]
MPSKDCGRVELAMKAFSLLYAILAVGLFIVVLPGFARGVSDDARPPAVAGQFYPDAPDALKAAVQAFLRDAVPRAAKKPIGLVVPHAGYIFSGQIAADGFKQVEGESYEVIAILGTNHTTPDFEKISVYNGRGFRTPLGVAEVDRETAAALLKADADCVTDERVHAKEHSIEVELPFVQVLFPGARIVPVIVGSPDAALCTRFGEALAKVLKNRRALIVASSDLSHYPSAAAAEGLDREVLAAIAALDGERLRSTIETHMRRPVANLVTCACGEAPILSAIEAAKRLGAKGGSVVSYANSGQTALGEQSRVVGYGAVVMTAEKGPAGVQKKGREPPYSDSFSEPERRALLAFARESMSRAVLTQTAPLARGFGENLEQKRAVFVTLEERGELRGCIGQTEPDTPLSQAVGAMAIRAAFFDPRFRPVSRQELAEIEIEISVLTRLKQVPRATDIVVGRDGVLLTKGEGSALFLPQVAVEQHWGLTTMLDNLCRKAGLEDACWREGARFSTFQAINFGERTHGPQ